MIHHEITGIVLAGGKSRRMGQDKALMNFRGKPLVQHAVELLRQVCGKVIISANKTHYGFTGSEIWPDEQDIQAPMIGIYSCLKRTRDEWILVLSCDMPFVDPKLLELLISSAGSGTRGVIIPVHDGDCIEPLCGLYHKSLIPLMEQRIRVRDYSLQHLIQQSNHLLLETGPFLSFYDPLIFLNINTTEDFKLLD